MPNYRSKSQRNILSQLLDHKISHREANVALVANIEAYGLGGRMSSSDLHSAHTHNNAALEPWMSPDERLGQTRLLKFTSPLID